MTNRFVISDDDDYLIIDRVTGEEFLLNEFRKDGSPKRLCSKLNRMDRKIHNQRKDLRKYTDYFMRELNWDCDRIMEEVFRW